jgi:hypothetical protein
VLSDDGDFQVAMFMVLIDHSPDDVRFTPLPIVVNNIVDGISDESDPGRQFEALGSFLAGDELEFFLNNGAGDVWSSDRRHNPDGLEYLRVITFPGFPNNYLLRWEDSSRLTGDSDFDDFVLFLSVGGDQNGNLMWDGGDTDEDGIWDAWEAFSMDLDGDFAFDLDLPALGADPFVKDIFLRIDYMDCTDLFCFPAHTHRPKEAAIDEVVRAFDDAPEPIRLHVEVGNPLPETQFIGFIPPEEEQENVASFRRLKEEYSGLNSEPLSLVYHYCIFGHRFWQSDTVGRAELFGNDSIVTLGLSLSGSPPNTDIDGDGLADALVGTVQNQAVVLMHELGHNLGLEHGGRTGIRDGFPAGLLEEDAMTNGKPQYLSLMNFSYTQLRGLLPDPDGHGPVQWHIDYSRNRLEFLDNFGFLVENELNEPVGIPPAQHRILYYCRRALTIGPSAGSVDWNCDGDVDDTSANGDVNNSFTFPDSYSGFADWPNLLFSFTTGPYFPAIVSFPDGETRDDDPLDPFTLAVLTKPAPDAGAVPDGNPNSPPGPTFEPYLATLGQTILLDGTGSNDEDGPLTVYEWDLPGGGAVDALGPTPSFVCDSFVGEAVAYLTVEDSDAQRVADCATIIVDLDAGADQTLECAGDPGNMVTLGAHLPGNPALSYTWRNDVGDVVGSSGTIGLTLHLGTHTFSLSVTDDRGATDSDSLSVIVQDTLPPVIEDLLAQSAVLPQRNRRLVNVGLNAVVADVCDPAPTIEVRVYSDEPERAADGGAIHAPDATALGLGTLQLRGERLGSGDGRVYLILAEATDASGNASLACTTVVVPHDASAESLASVQVQAAAAEMSCRTNGEPPPGFVEIGLQGLANQAR